MEAFLKWFDKIADKYGFAMDIRYSSIVDWNITIGYKYTHPNKNDVIVQVENCDIDLAFAMAQVKLKEWLAENKGGY